ncbi:DUF2663 family protein [Bacillus coahuilensis]|uniref:DUF2663 family protein n=1 Tax=Bacillus coahuilensis TaxID=408580 RepID=UPI0001850E2E|nr:DUF2663 family protein [Bacillus coahuilensis]
MKLKKRQLELVLAWFCLTILYTVYVVKTLLLPYRYSFLDLFNQLMTNQLSTFGLLAILFCLFAFKLLKEQKEKKEKEYHDLRKEIVDRSKDLWKEQRWNDRHIVFEHIEKNYDINLYHESK